MKIGNPVDMLIEKSKDATYWLNVHPSTTHIADSAVAQAFFSASAQPGAQCRLAGDVHNPTRRQMFLPESKICQCETLGQDQSDG